MDMQMLFENILLTIPNIRLLMRRKIKIEYLKCQAGTFKI